MFAWFRWESLSTKIIVWSFVPTAIILLVVALVTLNAYQEVTQDLVIERDRELTRLFASQLLSELREYVDLLDGETRTANLFNGNPNDQQAALIQASSRLAAFDGGVIVLGTFGQVAASLPQRPEIVGQNWSDRAYFHDVLRGNARPVFSDIVNDGPGGQPVVGIAVPIRNPQGAFQGVLFGMFRLDVNTGSAFYGSVVSLRLSGEGDMYLVDGMGRVIYHSDASRIGEDFSAQPVVRRIQEGQVNAIRTQDVDGRDIVAGFAPVPDTPWGLVKEQLWSSLTEDSRGHRKFLYLLLVLGVVVPTFVVAVGVKRIMRPIEELMNAAQAVARGRFGEAIAVSSRDEIGKLAEQFNLMSAELQASYAHLEQRVADRTRELSALYEVTAVANESLDLQETLARTFEQVLRALDAEIGSVQLLDDDGALSFAVRKGIPDEVAAAIEAEPQGAGLGAWILAHDQPLVLADLSRDERVAEAMRGTPACAYAGVPVRAKKKQLGVLSVVRDSDRQFSVEEVALLASIADQLGVSLENARLYQAQQRRAEQFRVISEVGGHITSILKLDELLVEFAKLIQEAFGFFHVGIGLIEEDEVVYKVGAGPLWQSPGSAFEPDRLRVGRDGISGWVAERGELLWVPDVSREPRYRPMKKGSEQIRSEIAVPIRAKGEVIGVLDIQSDQFDSFDDSDLVVLQSLADQAGIAIDNARLYKQAEQAAVMEERGRLARDLHDSVTQSLYSVRLFAEAAHRLAQQGDLPRTVDYIQQLGENAQQALKELRLLVYELRPSTLEHEGLVGALQQRLSTVEERAGVTAELVVEGVADLSDAVEEALYRIAQEALNNALKHAAAASVHVAIRSHDEQIELAVTDDGRGFDPEAAKEGGGIGMHSMRERVEKLGGTLEVVTAPGRGTTVRCQVSVH